MALFGAVFAILICTCTYRALDTVYGVDRCSPITEFGVVHFRIESGLSQSLIFRPLLLIYSHRSTLCHKSVDCNSNFQFGLILLLAGDISTNPGPKYTANPTRKPFGNGKPNAGFNLGLINTCSLRNKGPALASFISDSKIIVL